MNIEDIRKSVIAKMAQKGIKAAELSRRANLNPATVYNFLSGSDIRTSNLDKIFSVLR